MKFKRIILFVLDGCGIGVQRDYKKYQARPTNTIGNIYKNVSGFSLPFLESLGLGQLLGFSRNIIPEAAFGKMEQKSAGNDTFAGIWEMFGVPFKTRFNSHIAALSESQIASIRKRGVTTVGNVYISGYIALDAFFEEHRKTKGAILYFSDDGVILLAGHKDVLRVEDLNHIAGIIAEALHGQGFVRIITRPFFGTPNNFVRDETKRKDFLLLDLPTKSLITRLAEAKVGIRTTQHLHRIFNCPTGVSVMEQDYGNNKELFSFIEADTNKEYNLQLYVIPDTDNLGHKKDVQGFAESLTAFDKRFKKFSAGLGRDTLVIITADHGCDPTVDMRGHCREYVPLLLFSNAGFKKQKLGVRKTFGDIGTSLARNFWLDIHGQGTSFLNK